MGAFPNFFDIPDYEAKKPDGTRKYRAGQAPGTHWYHAHKHGSTSLHILNGLAGVFVIESNKEGGYDHVIRKHYLWGDSYGEHEKIIVLQQFDPTQHLERLKPPGPPVVLVNGKLTPTITMKPGEVQLWRIVNATEGNGAGITQPSLFQTPGFNFMQTAQDGVQLSQINYACQPFLGKPSPQCTVKNPVPVPGGLTLAGGNRADVLVQAPTTTGIVAFKSGKATLFYVNVTGTAVKPPNGPFPTFWPDLPKFLDDLPAPPPKDVMTPVQFQWESDRAGAGRNAAGFPPHFMLNGKQFGEKGEVIDQCMPLNAVQDWILENYTTVAHPFHIHINPFQVVQIDTPTAFGEYTNFKPLDNYVWQDVVAIPAGKVKLGSDNKTPVQPVQITPGRVRIRQAFLDFTGTFVLHCHILAHEDRGMMQLVRVVPADKYPAGCQGAIPDHH
jgi:FtsP/CotA-like multicopper oxidase with cupredoxin domain